jgi:hypothetical protein
MTKTGTGFTRSSVGGQPVSNHGAAGRQNLVLPDSVRQGSGGPMLVKV